MRLTDLTMLLVGYLHKETIYVKLLPDANFRNLLPKEKVFTELVEKLCISYESFSNFRVIQKSHVFKVKAVYT